MNGEDLRGWGGVRMVEVETKDVGDVKDVRNENAEFRKTLNDCNEEYIKRELKIK